MHGCVINRFLSSLFYLFLILFNISPAFASKCVAYIDKYSENFINGHLGQNLYTELDYDNAYFNYGLFTQASLGGAYWNAGKNSNDWGENFAHGAFYNARWLANFKGKKNKIFNFSVISSNNESIPFNSDFTNLSVYRGASNTKYNLEFEHASAVNEWFGGKLIQMTCYYCSSKELMHYPSEILDGLVPNYAVPLGGIINNSGPSNFNAYSSLGGAVKYKDFGWIISYAKSRGLDMESLLPLSRRLSWALLNQLEYSSDKLFLSAVSVMNHVGESGQNQMAQTSLSKKVDNILTEVLGAESTWEKGKIINSAGVIVQYKNTSWLLGFSSEYLAGKNEGGLSQKAFDVQIYTGYNGVLFGDNKIKFYLSAGIPLHLDSMNELPYFVALAVNWQLAKKMSISSDISYLHTSQLRGIGGPMNNNNFLTGRIAINWAYEEHINQY